MRINTANSLVKEPVFPKFTYSGSIELDSSHIISLVSEIQQMQLYRYNWGRSGWNSDPNELWTMTENISKITPLIVKQLFDVLVNTYNYEPDGNTYSVNNNRFFLECRRCFPVVLYPKHDMPIQIKQSYFTGITLLHCSPESHRPYIQNMDVNTVSETNDNLLRWWMPSPKQQIFIPGDVPWGISSGDDDTTSIALISHIIRKRA